MTVSVTPSLTARQSLRVKLTEQVKSKPEDAIFDDLVLWRLSIEQYHAIAQAGILDEDDPVELLEGLLVDKMTKKPPHTVATGLVRKALDAMLPAGWFWASQEPITLSASEPEPDFMIVRGELRHYLKRHPRPEDVALVVEVADSTLKRDRGTKKRIYAQAGIPIYWVINLIEQCIEVYTNPSGPTKKPDYLSREIYQPTDEIPVIVADQTLGLLQVRELLP